MSMVAGTLAAAAFRQRFVRGETLLSTFIKTPSSHGTEILGSLGFDFVVIDEEHAPFDRVAIDAALLGARAAGTAGIVRVADPSPAKLLAALDDGAAGVLVPHVSNPTKARDVAQACHYHNGKRGFSNSPRAGNYGGIGMASHIAAQDAAVTVIAMVEDPEALNDIDDIVAVDGIDGFFIGRGDLAVAFGATTQDAAPVRVATEKVIVAARAASKPVCIMVASASEAADFKALGVSAFIVSSDQGSMRQAAQAALADLAKLRKPP